MDTVIEYLVVAIVVVVFLIAAVAQVMAAYHFIRYVFTQPREQMWTRSLLGAFSLFWTRGLSDRTLRHLALFLRWEALFLAVAATFIAVDFFAKQQPNHFIQSGPAQAPAADERR